jgi:hypothetical protein
MLSRAIRAGVAALALVTTLSAAVACGAPEFTYVKNSGEKTYFKVPHEWQEISEKALDDAVISAPSESATADLIRERSWSVAYDAAAQPKPEHMFSWEVTDEPIVYAQVLQLSEEQRDAISLDLLRDSFLPVTAAARQAGAEELGLTGFELIQDEVLTPSDNIHGVRVVYDYLLPSGVLHTFDQTFLVNNAGDRLYALIIRCSTRCYRDRAEELSKIAESFTVRSKS